MALPAYDQCIKASHVFNLLDARGVISVTERQSYILRVRELAKACGAAWLKTEAAAASRRSATDARPPPRTLLRRNPRPHAAPGGGGSAQARHRCAGRARLRSTRAPRPSRRRGGWRCMSPACPCAGAGRARGAQGPARRRARRPPSRASCKAPASPRSTRRRSSERSQEGRVLRRRIERPGRPTPEVLAEILPADHPRPSPGRNRCAGARPPASPAPLRWVRPLHSILCTFGPETEEPEVVRFAVDGIASGDVTYGHRFLAPGADPGAALRRLRAGAGARQGRARRRPAQGHHPARRPRPRLRAGLELVEDEGAARGGRRARRMAGGADGLLRRALPRDPAGGDPRHHPRQPEMLRAARPSGEAGRACARQPASSSSPPNLDRASDGGAAIVAGNERVVRARLSDAKFFWETDQKVPLEDRLEKLEVHRVPREARHAGRAGRAHRGAGARARADRRRRSGARRARGAARQGRPRHRDGRRVPRAAGPDGPLLRGAAGRAPVRRRGDRGALQAARPVRPRADRPGLGGGGARRQDRHAGGLLGDRREADGIKDPMRCGGRRWG